MLENLLENLRDIVAVPLSTRYFNSTLNLLNCLFSGATCVSTWSLPASSRLAKSLSYSFGVFLRSMAVAACKYFCKILLSSAVIYFSFYLLSYSLLLFLSISTYCITEMLPM
jgi:hypothetical protein